MRLPDLQSEAFVAGRLEGPPGLSPVVVTFEPGQGTPEVIAEMAGEIKSAVYDVGLVVLRNAALCSREEFRNIGTEFGELENIGQIGESVDAPEDDPAWFIEEVSRSTDDTSRERPGIQRGVHQDRAYVDPPTDLSIFRVMKSAELGGNTNFVDMRRMYEILMEHGEMNDTIVEATDGAASINSLKVRHSYSHVLPDSQDVLGGDGLVGETTLPLVLEHPVTGRGAIFYSKATALRLYGIERRLGDALAARIVGLGKGEFSIRGELVPRYSHKWRATETTSDVLVWDNRVLGHASTSSVGDRYGERVTVRDDPPTNWHRL